MKNVDISMFVGGQAPSRIKPEEIDMADLPPIGKPQQATKQVNQVTTPLSSFQEEAPNTETERKSERTEFRTVLPIKRQTKRYSFEFYVDQISRLKKLQNQVESAGDSVSLSDMAREALDAYLQEKGELR